MIGAAHCLRRWLSSVGLMSTVTEPTSTEQQTAKVVEGSDGLLLELPDGRIVPNYDATIHPFSGRASVVTTLYNVVRIDNDEVLVDIGYKSEGVIPANGELSIPQVRQPLRRGIPEETRRGGRRRLASSPREELQDGRLILSQRRARFEKAWRKIEATASQSGEPVARRSSDRGRQGRTPSSTSAFAASCQRRSSTSAVSRTLTSTWGRRSSAR